MVLIGRRINSKIIHWNTFLDVQLKQPKLKKTAIPSLNLPDRDKHVKSFFSNEGLKISQRIVDVIENRDHNFEGEDDITEHSFLYSSTNDTESELEDVYDELVDAGNKVNKYSDGKKESNSPDSFQKFMFLLI